jgi:hypothetical protein
MRQLNESDVPRPVVERPERPESTIPAAAALKTSPFEVEDDHSEVAALSIALNDLTDEMNTPNEPENSTNEIMTEMMNDSLREDMVHHEEAIEAIRRELARADLGSDESIISKFRENQRNSDRSIGLASIALSKGSGGEDDDDSSMGSKLPGYRDDFERSLGSELHDSERSMGSSIYKKHHGNRKSATAKPQDSLDHSERSVGSSLRGSRHKKAMKLKVRGNRDEHSERSIPLRIHGSQKGSERSIGSRKSMSEEGGSQRSLELSRQNGELNVGWAPIEPTEPPPNAHLIQELRRVPSQSHWAQVVSIKHPKTILRRFRLLCGKVVENPHVQIGIIWLIIINAITMGIGTFDFVTESTNVDRAFEAIDRSFLIAFTIEISMQLIYRGLSLFADGWLVFDFVIVVISWSLESLQVIRAFRIFRAFRLVTRLDTLRELIMAIGNVMPRIYAIAMLLLLVFYIFAVLFTELFGDLELSKNYFGSLDASLFTCMELMTLEWASIARETMHLKTWAWVPFLGFISVTGFIVFNLIVAVVCDAVKVVDQQVKREKELELEAQAGGPAETDLSKLSEAQERIWELIDHIEMMRIHHKELQDVVALLASEVAAELGLPKKTPFNVASKVECIAPVDSRAPSSSSESSN